MRFQQLQNAIMALPHTGPDGFEGFVRDALTEVTGQGFRLMKSGPQGGVDMIGDPFSSGLAIGMEGKHYSSSTALPLDQLKSKLRDAAEEFASLDLWVLATTRPVSGGDSKALAETGNELGIAVVILDWPGGATLPSLAVLCAAAPATVAHHLGTKVAADLAAIRSHPSFDVESDRLLQQLTDASIGLTAARAKVRAWTIRQMRDLYSARTAFDSYAALEASDAVRIARPNVQQQLDSWWTTGPAGPAAILGQEGMGKTWAALSWWIERSYADPDFPLTLIIPARDVSTLDGPALLATALRRATNVRDQAFWEKRLARWSSTDRDRPVVIAIIDGLNQNWQYRQWSDLLVSLNTPDWRSKVAFALTCRPDHWHSQLKGLADSRLSITTIEVTRFDDAELDLLLQAHGIARKNLHPKLLDLLRSPRLSGIAIKRRSELEQGGEITPERLVFEDWRHRHYRAQQAMSHQEFVDFIAKLGREVAMESSGLTRKQVLDRLSRDGDDERDSLEMVFSELVEGGWLKRDDAGALHLDGSRVPAALGLALLADARRGGSTDERKEIIGQALDPLQGSDLSVAILKHAATFATIDKNVSSSVRRELLEAWLGAQNFSPDDFESYWRLIGCEPDLFIRIAEEEWFGNASVCRADEVLVKGFANALRWPEVEQAIASKLLQWFSRYWLDPLAGEVLGDLPDDESANKRREATRARAEAAVAEKLGQNFGITLVEVDPNRQAWGCYRATELLSWLPRAPLIKVFTAWAITRAILGGQRQFSALAWVLRWNEEDAEGTEEAVLGRARELLELQGEIARSAASSLLQALATPAASVLHDEEFGAPEELAECKISWPMRQDSRFADRPLDYVYDLAADPIDPSVELPGEFVERLRELAASVPNETLLASPWDIASGNSPPMLALSRWTPNALGALLRKRLTLALASSRVPALPGWLVKGWQLVAAALHRDGPTVDIKGIEWLAGSLPILNNDLLNGWSGLSRRLDKLGFAQPVELQLISLAGRPACEQIEILRRFREPNLLAKWVKRLLAPAQSAEIESLRPELVSGAPIGQILMWLDYLHAAGCQAIPLGWEPIALLFEHPDARARAAAFRLAYRCKDAALADHLANSAWIWSDDMDRDEAASGSFLLQLSSAAKAGQVSDRVHPEVLGWLAEAYPDQPIYLERWADYVHAELDFLAKAKSRSFPRALLQETAGWNELVAQYGVDLIEWTRPFVDASARHTSWMFIESFPLMRALEAIESIAPGSRAEVITRDLRDSARSNFRSGDLYHQGTTIVGPAGEEARQLVLDEANDDAKLFDFAVGVQNSGQSDWLINQIGLDLGGKSAGRIARGLTLAGFLQPTERADQLWAGRLASAPASGWLVDVHRAARQRYQRYKSARHWFDILRSTDDDDEAFAAFELFVCALDGRIYTGAERPNWEELERWPWRRQVLWSLGWERVRKTAKSSQDKLSKLYLASKPPLSNQAPRRR